MTPLFPGSFSSSRGVGGSSAGGGGGGGGGTDTITISAASDTGANGTWAGTTAAGNVRVRVLDPFGAQVLAVVDSTISGGTWGVTWPALLPGGYTVRAILRDSANKSLAQTNYSLTVADVPPPTSYTLTVTLSGTGAGRVTSSPAGIDTDLDVMAADFVDGTVVTLTETPAGSSTFTAWSGSGSGTTTRSVTMSANRTTNAEFSAVVTPTFTLSIARDGAGSGSVTGSGINCPGDCSEVVDTGTVVALTAVPAAGSDFLGWHEGATQFGTANPRNFTITSDRTIGATFALTVGPPLYSLTNQPPAGWNLYGDASVFNTPLADMPGLADDPFSATKAANAFAGSPALSATTDRNWSLPLYYGRATDPAYTLDIFDFGSKDYVQDLPASIRMPQNASASGSTGGDQNIWVYDQTDGYVYIFRLGQTANGGHIDHTAHVIHGSRCYRIHADGTGFNFPDEPAPHAQPIRPEELGEVGGDIGHMMALGVMTTYPGSVGWYSTSDSDGNPGGTINGNVRFGDVCYLARSDAQIAAVAGASEADKTLLRGLAHYGCIVERNNGGGWALKFENQVDRTSLGGNNPWGPIGPALTFQYGSIINFATYMRVVDHTTLPPRP